ncbi:MAG: succinate dehydrogenase assembly factor 2 [Alphaproteobacteria bacterium]|nr:succinate dehydrogenase assembly factor 2 [Alphaproteobacteria bacterium]NDC56269.1 succinate dehydrogenase assembly factor 2 [Alphaproteobacteria bacterium]NDG04400.1 succinate dehydrogenase assembly factor 2 [Alphaproteobacteria bacterium]
MASNPTHKPQDMRTLRARLMYQSAHRGTREMDLLLGSFARAHLDQFNESQLAEYHNLLNEKDNDLYDWYAGYLPVPAEKNTAVLQLFLAHPFAAS